MRYKNFVGFNYSTGCDSVDNSSKSSNDSTTFLNLNGFVLILKDNSK